MTGKRAMILDGASRTDVNMFNCLSTATFCYVFNCLPITRQANAACVWMLCWTELLDVGQEVMF